MKTYQVFYCRYEPEEFYEENDLFMTAEESAKKAEGILLEEEDFWGMTNDQGQTMQFMVEEDGKLCIDIPVEENEVVYAYYADGFEKNEIIQLIRDADSIDFMSLIDRFSLEKEDISL